jgi:hypothetical protein
MEGNNHPIVDCKGEIYPICGNFITTEVLLPSEVVFAGFRNNNMTVQVVNLAAETTKCGGSMCDKQDLYRNAGMKS